MAESKIASDYMPAGALRRVIRRVLPERLRNRVWARMVQTPGIYEVYAFVDPTIRARRVTRRSDLVMDGVARCANTYAQAAFGYANGTRFSVAHHLHAARSVVLGVRYGLPTIVLIRNPTDVLASSLQFNPGYEPRSRIADYRQYYERVLPLVDRVLVADFDDVTSDFDSVIQHCNAKFGTSFSGYVRSDQSEEAIMAMIDSVAVQAHAPEHFAMAVSRPSENRRSSADIVAELSSTDREDLAEAQALYTRILDLAGRH